jgi:hypothetical protein
MVQDRRYLLAALRRGAAPGSLHTSRTSTMSAISEAAWSCWPPSLMRTGDPAPASFTSPVIATKRADDGHCVGALLNSALLFLVSLAEFGCERRNYGLEAGMIDTAWDEYRAWAARARELQKSSQNWITAALVSATAAAVFGAGAIQAAGYPRVAQALSLAAAVAAGAVPILGKEILTTAPKRHGSALARPRRQSNPSAIAMLPG